MQGVHPAGHASLENPGRHNVVPARRRHRRLSSWCPTSITLLLAGNKNNSHPLSGEGDSLAHMGAGCRARAAGSWAPGCHALSDPLSCEHSFVLKLTAPPKGGTAAGPPGDSLSLPGRGDDFGSRLRRVGTSFSEIPSPVPRLQSVLHSPETQSHATRRVWLPPKFPGPVGKVPDEAVLLLWTCQRKSASSPRRQRCGFAESPASSTPSLPTLRAPTPLLCAGFSAGLAAGGLVLQLHLDVITSQRPSHGGLRLPGTTCP